jgi:uncharacterized membrane protein
MFFDRNRLRQSGWLTLTFGLLATLLAGHINNSVAEEMRGLLIFGHEARTLQLCGDTRTFWVSAPEVRHVLEQEYRRLAIRPYDPVYAELDGAFIDRPGTGFAADYDGTVEINKIHLLSRERVGACRAQAAPATPGPARFDDADFRATGNEPGWNLEIREGRRIVLVTDYGASRVELALPEPIIGTEARTTRWDAGELTLEVIDRPCRDSMSGDWFEAEVVVTWKEKRLRGCGRAFH